MSDTPLTQTRSSDVRAHASRPRSARAAALDALLRAVENIGAGSVTLDADIAEHLSPWLYKTCRHAYEDMLATAEANGLTDRKDACWRSAFSAIPNYTSSLDASAALLSSVLGGGWLFQVKSGVMAEAVVWTLGRDYDDDTKPHLGAPFARHLIPALALIEAILIAMIEEETRYG